MFFRLLFFNQAKVINKITAIQVPETVANMVCIIVFSFMLFKSLFDSEKKIYIFDKALIK